MQCQGRLWGLIKQINMSHIYSLVSRRRDFVEQSNCVEQSLYEVSTCVHNANVRLEHTYTSKLSEHFSTSKDRSKMSTINPFEIAKETFGFDYCTATCIRSAYFSESFPWFRLKDDTLAKFLCKQNFCKVFWCKLGCNFVRDTFLIWPYIVDLLLLLMLLMLSLCCSRASSSVFVHNRHDVGQQHRLHQRRLRRRVCHVIRLYIDLIDCMT